MTFDPIFTAEPIIQLHILFAVAALMASPFALFRRRRDRLHKVTGYIAVVGILGLALSGLAIKSNIAVVLHFGPIHVFSLLATWGVAEAMYYIWKGDIRRHQKAMLSTWFGALGLAGLFTFLPGRTMNRALLGGSEVLGYVVIGLGLLGLALLWRRRGRWAVPPKSRQG